MPFPVHLDDLAFPQPRELARHLAEVARGRSLPRPWQTLARLVSEGALTRDEGVALAGAFVEQPDAALICEGARMAWWLGEERLGPLLMQAIAAHDAALLLGPDPAEPARSVEDTLLVAATRVADGSDPEVRTVLLHRLRTAGLPALEVALLCAHGTPPELERWLPAVFAEGLESEGITHLALRLARGDDGAEVVRRSMIALDEGTRAAVLAASGFGTSPAEA